MSDPSPTLAELRAAFVEGCRRMHPGGTWYARDGDCLTREPATAVFARWAAERYPDPWMTSPTGHQYRFRADGVLMRRPTWTNDWSEITEFNREEYAFVAALLAQHQKEEGP